MKTHLIVYLAILFFGLASCKPSNTQRKTYKLYFDENITQVQFGSAEIIKECNKSGIKTESAPISSFISNSNPISIIIVSTNQDVKELCQTLRLSIPTQDNPQSYSIRKKQNGENVVYAVFGTDANGAMYGALDIAETIKLKELDKMQEIDKTPYIANRGIKFNIPLDIRTPSYADNADASQLNISEMWEMDFWKEFLDEMARYRYNVLSLWSLHPFPSLIKVPEFPDVALNDVWRKTSDFGKRYNIEDRETYEIVKKITIDDKIKFWQDVMQYGHDRGIDFYWVTWNVFTSGATGKHGIRQSQTSDTTIAYIRASTRELILTYPLLAGFGITAGENMENRTDEYSNEKWLWKTYGEGVRDALKIQPKRDFRMIHRFHLASQKEILDEWKDYPGVFDFSFKYSYAHMYSMTKPIFLESFLEYLDPNMKVWLTVRNDDIYSFRWGDPDYAREYIIGMPPAKQLAGFYMGSDGYCLGREFLSTEPESPRELVIKKQWYSFMLWGRLSFDPTLSNTFFQKTLEVRFPEVSSEKLFRASKEASQIFPEVTRFFWGDIDVKWLPEACMRRNNFLTIRDFILQGTMPGSGNLNIRIWRKKYLNKEVMDGKTPHEVAASLKNYAQNTLTLVEELRTNPSNNKELRLTLGDYEAFAHIGNYYAEKILGAADIALYDTTKNIAEQISAIKHLELALGHWEKYSAIYTKQNIQPVLYGRSGLVDIPGLTKQVEKDIEMAKNWQFGSLLGPLRGPTEPNFKP